MKRIGMLVATVMSVGVAQNALAADMPVRQAYPVVPVAVAPTWTGLYVGFNGGWGWTSSNNNNLNLTGAFAPFTIGNSSNNANSPVFGGQVGYNYQTGNWVWGIEGDFDGANIRATQAGLVPAVGTAFATEKQDWLASIRGRLGYTWGPGMIYVTGGGAWTGVKVTGGGTVFATGESATFSTSSTRSGYVVGAGYEWMIAPNWALRGEYLFYGFNGGNNTSTLVFPVSGATITGNVNKFNTSVVRVGLDYKFDWMR